MRYILFCLFMCFGIPCSSAQPTKAIHLSDTPDPFEEIHIFINGKEMTLNQYLDEYVTKYEFIPETRKFKVTHCKREKELVEKGKHKHRGHGSHANEHRPYRNGRIQWFRCRICGKYLRGYKEASEHYDEVGHRLFDKTEI